MEIKSASDIFGYSFIVLGIIIGAHTILERLFHYSLFTTFLKLAPGAISNLPDEKPFAAWLEARTLNRKPHEMWDVALFYFFILSAVFFMMSGCWLFLILRLLSIVNFPMVWLIIWFIFNAFIFFVSAINQAFVFFKFKDRRLKRIKTIIARMAQNQTLTLKLVLKFFLTNWFLSPLNALRILLIDLLIIILFWPFWLIQLLISDKIDLNIDKTRTTYFIACTTFFTFIGVSLSFFF